MPSTRTVPLSGSISAAAMRSVVVDYARQRLAQKRGGDLHRVTELPENIESGLRLDAGEKHLHRCLTLTPDKGDPAPAAVHWCLGQIAERHENTTSARIAYETASATKIEDSPVRVGVGIRRILGLQRIALFPVI